MRKIVFGLLLMASATIILSSCGKKAPKESKYITKDASAVIIINPSSLEEKLKKGNLSIDSLAKVFEGEASFDSTAKKEWEAIKNAGVSFSDNIYLIINQGGSITNGQTNTITVMANLKDAAKLEAYLKEQSSLKGKPLSKEKNCTYLEINDESSLAWNGEVVMASFFSKNSTGSFDSLGNYIMPDRSSYAKELKQNITKYFELKDNEQVASLDLYKDMFKKKADGYMFGSANGTLAALSSTPLNLPKVQELLKDNYSATTFNFEEGKIVATGTTYTNPMLSSILKKYAGPTVNTGFTENFPAQTVNGVVLTSFNPELFDGLLKELEVKGMLEAVLAQQQLTSADLFKCLKGEINVAFGDFALTQKEVTTNYGGTPYTYTSEMPTGKLIITAPVGDKAAFEKIMEKAVATGIAVKTANGYTGGTLIGASGLYVNANSSTITIASDSATYAAFMAGKTKSTISADVVAKLKGKSTAGYINIQSILQSLLTNIKDESMVKALGLVNATFKDVVLTSDNFDGKGVSSALEVNMVNTKENSLVSVANLVTGVYKIIKEQEAKRKMTIEESMAPPAAEDYKATPNK